MADPPDKDRIDATLFVLTRTLREAGVPYMIVGGLATFAYGTPRTTRDIDIVIDKSERTEDEIRAILERTGFPVEGPIQGEFGRRFKVIGDMLPADVFLYGKMPHQQQEFERSELFHFGDTQHRVISKEDFIVHKLINLKVRRSERDVRDLFDVLFVQWKGINFEYVRQKAAFYRMEKAFNQFVEEVRAARKEKGLPD